MKLMAITVYDKAVELYLPPFFARSGDEACRMLLDAARDPNHSFCKHPTDYKVYRIGEYHDMSGLFVSEDAPVFLFSMEQLLNAEVEN
ncbi:phage ORF5 protein [Rheinheimera sp.]|uniref:phage ORF5 protein n=1 Tax=Rheinheimera sp. TaxID=1869214 RepID=UPI0040487124